MLFPDWPIILPVTCQVCCDWLFLWSVDWSFASIEQHIIMKVGPFILEVAGPHSDSLFVFFLLQ